MPRGVSTVYRGGELDWEGAKRQCGVTLYKWAAARELPQIPWETPS